MADINLTQEQADALIEMEKQRVDKKQWDFPVPGERLMIPLISPDKRENFMLDVTRAQIKLTKATYQNRARQAIILMRLDLDGPPHRNGVALSTEQKRTLSRKVRIMLELRATQRSRIRGSILSGTSYSASFGQFDGRKTRFQLETRHRNNIL